MGIKFKYKKKKHIPMCTLQFLGQIIVGVVIIWVTQSHSRWQLILFPKTKWNWKYVIFGFLGIISQGTWYLFWCDLIKWWSTAWRHRKWVFLRAFVYFRRYLSSEITIFLAYCTQRKIYKCFQSNPTSGWKWF